VDELAVADILLAEDSDADAELTLRALRKGNLLNKRAKGVYLQP
jgi:hypothetical protein